MNYEELSTDVLNDLLKHWAAELVTCGKKGYGGMPKDTENIMGYIVAINDVLGARGISDVPEISRHAEGFSYGYYS